MKFDELYSSELRPFQDYVSVRTAKRLGIISAKYSSIFEDDCACSSERIVRVQKGSGSITAVTCCDPQCPLKMKYQVNEVFERFGVKGIGPETCGKVVDSVWMKNGKVTLYDVIVDGPKYSNLVGNESYVFLSALEKIVESRVTFGRFIANLSYPFIGMKFEDVFRGISNIDEFVSVATNEGGLFSFLANRSVKSVDTIFHFIYYLMEMSEIVKYYKDSIVSSGSIIIPICMTGRMETSHKKYTKEEYLYSCNLLLMDADGVKDIDFVSTETVSKAKFVIAGPDSVARRTAKFRKAIEMEEYLLSSGELLAGEKFLYTPDEFLYYLLKGEDSSE